MKPPIRFGPVGESFSQILPGHLPDASWAAKLMTFVTRPAFVCLVLVAVTLAVYSPVISFDFVSYDDPVFVTENPFALAGVTWDGVIWAMSSGDLGNWVPLARLSHMLDVQLFGLNPSGHHLTNLLLHVANTALLFLVLRRLTAAHWRSAVVAAFFALHPLHVESVAWISERRDVLSMFFLLLALWAYARFAEAKAESRKQIAEMPDAQLSTFNSKRRWYCLALFFFALGLVSKAIVVTLPFVLLLLDYWPLRRFELSTPWRGEARRRRLNPQHSTIWRLVIEKLPFLGLALLAGVVTLCAQRRAGGLPSLVQLPILTRLCNAILSYANYLLQVLWPSGLVVHYPYPESFSFLVVAGAALILLLISLLALLALQRRPYVAVGWLWYVVTLLPVVGLIQTGGHAHADRYTYLPLTGLFVMIVWGMHALVWHRGQAHRMLLVFAMTTALIGCVGATRVQMGYWKNGETLWVHAVAVNDRNWLAHYNLAMHLKQKGEFNAAILHYAKVVSIRHDPDALNNMAWIFATCPDAQFRKGKQAVEFAARAVELTRAADASKLDTLAAAYAEAGRFGEAGETAKKTFALAKESGDVKLAEEIVVRLRLYEQGKPYREGPSVKQKEENRE